MRNSTSLRVLRLRFRDRGPGRIDVSLDAPRRDAPSRSGDYRAIRDRSEVVRQGCVEQRFVRPRGLAGWPGSIAYLLAVLFFTAGPVTDYDSAKKCDTEKFAKFFWAMMDRGFYLPCSQFEAAFLMTPHTERIIDDTIAAARDALAASLI